MFSAETLSLVELDVNCAGGQLARDLKESLDKTGYTQLSKLQVLIEGANVCLRGRLSSYFLKQKALHVALANSEIASLIDDIVVAN